MKTIIVATVLVFAATAAQSRTWRVNTAGTGDAPTLHAAMDSAAAGDVVLVEAGEYPMESGLSVPSGVRLVGESGPAHTLVYVVFSYDLPPTTVSLRSGADMSGIHVRGSTTVVVYSVNADVDHCIIESENDFKVVEGSNSNFINCLLLGGVCNIVATYGQCIIYSTLGFGAIGSTVFSCDVLGSVDPSIDASATNFNFSLDPQFCGIPGSGNYFLQSTSPCLGANNPFEPLPFDIGPLGAGCGTVRVEERTWGGVKALYRNP
ncbi:MAG TPA: hypothetical protein VFX92_00020 [Candidatus Krumholzibacteria bacterium]|nr:hypothetical protein [Candidatus Krumholzibacteria bacterium]